MGASCSTGASQRAGQRDSGPAPLYRCQLHHHRHSQLSPSPYPKSPLARLHSFLPSSPFPCLNGLVRLKRSLLRIDPASSLSKPSSNAVTSLSAPSLHSHVYCSVLTPTDSLGDLVSRTPVGSFTYVVFSAQPTTNASLTLPLHIAYHYHPRHEASSPPSLPSHRPPSCTRVYTAQTGLTVTLTRLAEMRPTRRESVETAFPSHFYSARMSAAQYRRLERLSFGFLPHLRAFLLDATRHPAFASSDAGDDEASPPPPASSPFPSDCPFQLRSYTDRHRTGLLLTFPAPQSVAFHADIEWKREQPRLHCKELGILLDDSTRHSLPCFVAKAWLAAGGTRDANDWRRLGLDVYATSPHPLLAAAGTKGAAMCSPRSAFPCCARSTLRPPSTSPSPANSQGSKSGGFDRGFLVSFLREYAHHYAGSLTLDAVVSTLNPQTLLTPKRSSMTLMAAVAAQAKAGREEGEAHRFRQGVQEQLIKVMEAVKAVLALDDEAPRVPQWCIDVTDPLLHILCLHAAHHTLVHTGLAILQLMALNAACHLSLQRMLHSHLARHPLCPGVLLAVFHLLSTSPALVQSMASTNSPAVLAAVHHLVSSCLLPQSALSPPQLPSLPALPPPAVEAVEQSNSPPSQLETVQSRSRASSAAIPSRVLRAVGLRPAALQPTTARVVGSAAGSPVLLSPRRPRSSSAQQALLPLVLSSSLSAFPVLTPTSSALRFVSFNRTANSARPVKEEEEKRQTPEEGSPADTPILPSSGLLSPSVRRILKTSPAMRHRESLVSSLDRSGGAEEDEGESSDSERRTARMVDGRSGDSAAFSFQRQNSALRPSKSMLRLVHIPHGGDGEEEKERQPASSPSAGVVIPKLKLNLALNTQMTPSMPAPLSSLRHTRRMRTRSDAASRLTLVAQGDGGSSMPTFSFPFSHASPAAPSHRLSLLDPPDASARPHSHRLSVDVNDAEGRAAQRRLRDVAVGAGECFVTSQLATLLWYKLHVAQPDLGWTARLASADDSPYEGEGRRRKDTVSVSSWGQMQPVSTFPTSRELGGGAEAGSALTSGDAVVFHCAALALQCLVLLADATAASSRAAVLAELVGVWSAVTRSCHPAPTAAADSGSVMQRLPVVHLRYYEQLLCRAIQRFSSSSLPQPISLALTASTSHWQLRLGPSSPALVPLLTSAGLASPFQRSFGAGAAVCLLPINLLTTAASPRALPQSNLRSPLTLLPSYDEADGADAATAPSTSAVTSTRAPDAFYPRMAADLSAVVAQLALIQRSTPHDDAASVLQVAAGCLHALHRYAITPACSRGLRSCLATAVCHPLPPQFIPSKASDDSCQCGGAIALLLHSCGPSLIDVHGQLSRLYRLCKELAAATTAAGALPPPLWSPTAQLSPTVPLEVDRLAAVNALVCLWVSLLSHPSSHATHSLLVRLLRDPTVLPEDAEYDALRFDGELKAAIGGGGRSARMRPSVFNQKLAMFSVLDFVHHHAALVFAPTATAYCLFAPSAHAVARKPLAEAAVFNSQRASLATTMLRGSSKGASNGGLTGSSRDLHGTAPPSAHSPPQAGEDEEGEGHSPPTPLHPVVHSARLHVLAFYRAVAWLLQRVADAPSDDADTTDSTWEAGLRDPTARLANPDPTADASGRTSGRDAIVEEEAADDEDSRGCGGGGGDCSEDERGRDGEWEDGGSDDSSPRQRRQERRTQAQARHRRSTTGLVDGHGGGEGVVDRFAWYWAVVGEAVAGPHGLIARFVQQAVTADSRRGSEGAGGEEDSDSEGDEPLSPTSTSHSSLSSASSNDSNPATTPRRSDRHLAQRLFDFDLLSSYCALWGDLLGWRGAACPFQRDDRLLDGLTRFHFVAFIRLYHSPLGLDALRADTCALHLRVLHAVVASTPLLVAAPAAVVAAVTTRARRGSSRAVVEDDPSDAVASPRASSHPLRATADAVCAVFHRLRVVHFLVREMSAEHDTFVARSYLAQGLGAGGSAAVSAATNTASNTARTLPVFSPQLSRGTSSFSISSPGGRRSLAVSPQPSMQHTTAALQLDVNAPAISSHTPLSPMFNLDRAMNSSLTLQAAANQPSTASLRPEASDPPQHSEHRRSASSPVNISPPEMWGPAGGTLGEPLTAATSPSFLATGESALTIALTTHPEEDDDHLEDGLGERSRSRTPRQLSQAGDEAAKAAEDEEADDADEADGSSDTASEPSLASLQEETAIRREHADEVDPDDDVVSEPASVRHSRAHPATSSRPVSRMSPTSKSAKQVGILESPVDGDEDRVEEDTGEEGDDDFEYEASDVSVSRKRPAAALLALALPSGGQSEEGEADGAAGDEEGSLGDAEEDDDDAYEASDLSSVRKPHEDGNAPPTERPRFQLKIAAQDVEVEGNEAGDEEAEDGAGGSDDEEDDMNGWSDSEPSQPASARHPGGSAAALKLQLLLPSTSVSASPSLSAAALPPSPPGEQDGRPSLSTDSLTMPALRLGGHSPEMDLKSLPSLHPSPPPPTRPEPTTSARSDRLSDASDTPALTNTPPTDTPPEGGSSSRALSFRASRHRASLSLHLPALPSQSPLRLGASTSSPSPPTRGVFLLDAPLPGVPDLALNGESPPLLPVAPRVQPPLGPLRVGRPSLGLTLQPLALTRSSSSPYQRPTLAPAPSLAGIADDESGGAPLASFSSVSSSASPLPTSARKSGRGKSIGVKINSAAEVYARQRRHRRLYEHCSLHVSMLRLLLRLLVDPTDAALSSLYCDRAVTAANTKADADVDVLTSLHSHLNHPLNAPVLPHLFASSLTPHSSPITRLLKLLCEPLFPASLFLHPLLHPDRPRPVRAGLPRPAAAHGPPAGREADRYGVHRAPARGPLRPVHGGVGHGAHALPRRCGAADGVRREPRPVLPRHARHGQERQGLARRGGPRPLGSTHRPPLGC